MFLGEYTHNLDSKGRLTIPAKFRASFAQGLVVTRNPADQCLLVFPRDEWDKLAEKVSALPLTDPRSAQFRRAFFSAAEDLEPDGQGRILLGQRLREHAKIETDVIIAGQNKFLELWTPTLWDEKVLKEINSADFSSDFYSALSL
ncbi:MAG: division/cell wall cluster transcriptional repressor MraZ [Anaerolineales bacterium]|nr:division/cell wall cluster transcriptional repressor MraZ [Anaerolineales bacterium]